jgi:hypothetical protein
MMYKQYEVPESFRLPEAMWEKIKGLIPAAAPKPKGGRLLSDN